MASDWIKAGLLDWETGISDRSMYYLDKVEKSDIWFWIHHLFK